MNNVLYTLARCDVSVMGGWHPVPSTSIARTLKISVGKARYELNKLKGKGLIESFYEGGQTDDGKVFCLHGYRLTDLGKNTIEYEKALEEERKICKEVFNIDI